MVRHTIPVNMDLLHSAKGHSRWVNVGVTIENVFFNICM